jgi:hypothetical protein
MRAYFDPNVSAEELRCIHSGFVTRAASYDPLDVRNRLLKTSGFRESSIVRFAVLPFDLRWAYLERQGGLWNRIRPELLVSSRITCRFLLTRRHAPKAPDGAAFHAACHLGDQHVMHKDAYFIPFAVPDTEAEGTNLFTDGDKRSSRANLSGIARSYLSELGITNLDTDEKTAGLIWMHTLAIGYSPAYLVENADGIRRDWPRIPLPRTKKALLASALLGQRIGALLDTEKPVDGISAGKIDARVREIAVVSKVGSGGLNPDEGHLDITVGWGHAGKGGVCMPGTGKHETRAQRDESLKAAFGEETLDIYLNGTAYWSNLPKCVWDYHIGGYQVIKKWLSYREKAILGRGLRVEEAEYVTEMTRRIAALILMQPDLDANYEGVKADTWPWPHENPATK